MGLSLKQANGVRALAQALYDLLPGGGAEFWKGHINFGTVAAELGLREFWPPAGSKLPRLVSLLERTFERRPDRFEPLILAIVRKGLTYRQGKGNPISPAEVDAINGALLDVGMRLPDLWDLAFREAVSRTDTERAEQNIASARRADEVVTTESHARVKALHALEAELISLSSQAERQDAGLQLEQLLNKLFSLEGLAPRTPFRVVGEQIDGSFLLDNETYLMEAKWHSKPCPEADLLVFHGKIAGKSAFTRGIFISLNGVSLPARDAITRGKQANFFVVQGHDLMMVFRNAITLPEFLRRRQRLLSEEGAVVAEFNRIHSR